MSNEGGSTMERAPTARAMDIPAIVDWRIKMLGQKLSQLDCTDARKKEELTPLSSGADEKTRLQSAQW
jgi:hypothetical protein